MRVMLYKKGGPVEISGETFTTCIVDESEVAAKKKEGWASTPGEALKPKRTPRKTKAK